MVTCSALTGAGAEKIMPAVLVRFRHLEPPCAHGRSSTAGWRARPCIIRRRSWPAGRLKLRYITQVKARPPTFALFASKPSSLPESYRRYLVNGIGAEFGLAGVPIRLMLRAGKNPYAPN